MQLAINTIYADHNDLEYGPLELLDCAGPFRWTSRQKYWTDEGRYNPEFGQSRYDLVRVVRFIGAIPSEIIDPDSLDKLAARLTVSATFNRTIIRHFAAPSK